MVEFSSQTYTPDALTAGNENLLTGVKITIESGQNLIRGAVLGKVTASGEYKLSASAAGDGSEVPDLILVEDCDASGGVKEALGYSRGDFNANALTLGIGHSIASIKEGLRSKGIVLVNAIPAQSIPPM